VSTLAYFNGSQLFFANVNSASVLLATIVADWNKALNRDIPNLAEPAAKDIDTMVNNLMIQLDTSITSVVPELRPFLTQIEAAMEHVKEQVKDRMSDKLRGVSRDASETHPGLVKFIQPKWTRTFNEASELRGKLILVFVWYFRMSPMLINNIAKGSGSLAARQARLMAFATKSHKRMFSAAFNHLARKVKSNFDTLHRGLASISKFAKESIQAGTNALLDNTILPTAKHEEDTAEKLALQQDVRDVLLKWNTAWKAPESAAESKDVTIPEMYDHRAESKDEEDGMFMDIDDEYDENKNDDGSNWDTDTDDDSFII
jgi:hypothetical protein